MNTDPHGPLYSVVCTDTNPYATWQTEFLEHTWNQSGMPGELLRLVAAPGGGALPEHTTARVVRTSAPNGHDLLDEPYVPMNRLHSFEEWLETERPVGTVLIIDPDFVFRAPIDRRAQPGRPTGQSWADWRWEGRWADVARQHGASVASLQAVTWPMIVHTSDLRRIMPRWIHLTAQIRRDHGAWESDMVALPIVLAELGLVCDLEMLAAWMPWPDGVTAGAPIIHYCQPVLDRAGRQLWFKQGYRPWDELGVDPDDAALDYAGELLRMLDRYASIRRAVERGLRS